MRALIGCSSVIALIAFIIGFAVSLFISEATWTERLMMAGMPAAIAFIAAFLLSIRDFTRHHTVMRTVRGHLLACSDTSDEHFLSSRPCDDAALLVETRKAISRFFDVPAVKVGRNVHLLRDLHVDKLEPSFQFYVVDSVISSQSVEPKPFAFAMVGLESIDDLTKAIRKVLNGFDSKNPTEDAHEA
ncbi:MAG: hypothetical protein JXB10_08840 [Pirellulales bacterium]|nr:hypothetical protein [Pirellulales bacterium]